MSLLQLIDQPLRSKSQKDMQNKQSSPSMPDNCPQSSSNKRCSKLNQYKFQLDNLSKMLLTKQNNIPLHKRQLLQTILWWHNMIQQCMQSKPLSQSMLGKFPRDSLSSSELKMPQHKFQPDNLSMRTTKKPSKILPHILLLRLIFL